MRFLLIVVGIIIANPAAARESTTVDGVVVHGRIDTVSVTDIHEAIADFVAHASGKTKPAVIEILSKNEMRAYRDDKSWTVIRRMPVADRDPRDKFEWFVWGRDIVEAPELLRFMRRASHVYVFPVIVPVKARNKLMIFFGQPPRDDKHMRLLEANARRDLVRLVGYQRNWGYGVDHTIWVGDAPRNVGFLFRKNRRDLVLFFTGSSPEIIAPDGERLRGFFEHKQAIEIENWKKRYAQQELLAR